MIRDIPEKVLRAFRMGGILRIISTAAQKIYFLNVIWRSCYTFYLRKKYSYVIQKYKAQTHCPPPQSTQNCLDEYRNVIWCMWWQGEENSPEIVKLCRESLRRNCGSHKIIIITEKNYQDYITLPEHIISKVKSGRITLTHLSDIIRAGLLAKYGGLWADATIFVAEKIPEYVFTYEYFTIKETSDKLPKNTNPAFGRWTAFLFGAGSPGSQLFCFLYDMFLEYWKTHVKMAEYFLIDYSIFLAFEAFPEFREAWKHIPVNNLMWNELVNSLNEKFDGNKYSELCESTFFFKLMYKKDFIAETEKHEPTFYGHLLSEYGISK